MSHNDDDVTRSARNHRPAIIGIAAALLVALLAYLVFMPGTNEQDQGIATTPPPAGTTTTEAGGIGAENPDADETAEPDAPAPVPAD